MVKCEVCESCISFVCSLSPLKASRRRIISSSQEKIGLSFPKGLTAVISISLIWINLTPSSYCQICKGNAPGAWEGGEDGQHVGSLWKNLPLTSVKELGDLESPT